MQWRRSEIKSVCGGYGGEIQTASFSSHVNCFGRWRRGMGGCGARGFAGLNYESLSVLFCPNQRRMSWNGKNAPSSPCFCLLSICSLCSSGEWNLPLSSSDLGGVGEGDGGLDLIARKKVARVESHVKKTHTRTKCFPNFIKTAEFSSAAVIQRKTFKTGRAIQ